MLLVRGCCYLSVNPQWLMCCTGMQVGGVVDYVDSLRDKQQVEKGRKRHEIMQFHGVIYTGMLR